MKKNKKNRKFNFNVINAVILGVLISLSLTLPFMKGKQDNLQSTEVALTSEFSIESEGENHIINVVEKPATVENIGSVEPENETQVSTEDEGKPEAEAEEPVEAEPEQEPEVEQKVQEAQDYSETKEFQDRCRLTYAESGLEDEIGQVAVAATIIHRQYSPEFRADGDFYNVMNNGFSSVRNGEIYIMTSNPYVLYYEDVPERTIRATERALNGEDPIEQLLWEEAERLGLDPEVYAAGGAKYFYNPNVCSEAALAERANIKCKVQIGNHVFYKVWDQ
jgi:spore germination cell wall hydrolase CwlJ-like protein